MRSLLISTRSLARIPSRSLRKSRPLDPPTWPPPVSYSYMHSSKSRIRTIDYIYIYGLLLFAGLTQSACDMKNYTHVTIAADFALHLREQLEYVNEHSFNNFKLQIGELRIRHLMNQRRIICTQLFHFFASFVF